MEVFFYLQQHAQLNYINRVHQTIQIHRLYVFVFIAADSVHISYFEQYQETKVIRRGKKEVTKINAD
jgi:hypothetical protein